MLKNIACIICLMALAFLGHCSDLDSLKPYPISFENTTGQTETYALDLDRWAYADFYYRVEGGPLLHKRTGLFVPYRERDHSFLNLLQIRVELKAGQALEGELHLVRAPYLGPPPRLKGIEAIPVDQADSKSWNRLAFSLIICLVLLFIFIYNLLFYSVTRNMLYRFYLPSVIVIFLETVRESGLATHFLGNWDSYAGFDRYLGCTLTLLLILFSSFFLRDLIQLPKRYPLFNRLFFVYVGMCCIVWGITVIDFGLGTKITLVGLPLFLVLQVYVAAVNWWKGYQYSFPFFLVSLTLASSTSLHMVSLSGVIDIEGAFFFNLRSLGMALTDTFMAFLLGKIVWDLRKENMEQQEQIIEALQKEKQVQLQIAISVSEIQEIERQKFALRIQEDLQNDLATIRFSLMGLEESPPRDPGELATRLGLVHQYVNESLGKTQQIAYDINPAGIGKKGGFSGAVLAFVQNQSSKGLQITTSFEGLDNTPPQLRHAALQIVEQMLSNSALFSQEGALELVQAQEKLRISLEMQAKKAAGDSFWTQEAIDRYKKSAQVFGGNAELASPNCLIVEIDTTVDKSSLQTITLY